MIEPLLTSNSALSPKPPAAWPFRSAAPGVMLLREESTQHPFALAVAALLWRSMRVKTDRKIPVQVADAGGFPIPPLPQASKEKADA